MGRKLLNIIIAVPLMLSIISTSSGITFFIHHCHCEHRLLVSIAEKIICEEDYSHELLNSGSKTDGTINIHFETESCGCQNESFTFKLSDVNTFTSINISLDKVQPFESLFVNSPEPVLVSSKEQIYFESPPPLIWRRMLLVLYQSEKNPEHIFIA